ncbi:MAG: HAMP domain-containing sensor histidine kinase, partial [Bacteroidota bacterium]
ADSLLEVALAIMKDAEARFRIGTYFSETTEISIKVNQADLRIEEGNYFAAIEILNQLLDQKSDYLELTHRASIFHSLARANLGLGKSQVARQWAERAILDFRALNYVEEISKVLTTLVDASAGLGDFQAAYQYQRDFQQVRDSLNSLQRRREYQYLLLDYEKELDQRKIAELEQGRLKSQNQQNLLLAMLGLVLAFIAFMVVFFRFRQRQNLALLAQERKLDAMKTRFFTQISHELRTPLTLILGPLEQLLEGEEKADRKKLTLMRRNANRLLELVNQVLDLAKLKEGHFKLQAQATDIVQWSRIIFSSFHSKAELKQLEYQLYAPQEPVILLLDREKYQQILSNLLANGLKFTPEGGKLHLSIADHEEEVVLALTDTGPGLSEEERAHVF